MIVLPDAEDSTILSAFVCTKHRNVTEGQTDRQICRDLQRSALRMRCKNGRNCLSYLSVICACVSVRLCVNHGGTGTYHNRYTNTLTSNLTLTNPLMNSNQIKTKN